MEDPSKGQKDSRDIPELLDKLSAHVDESQMQPEDVLLMGGGATVAYLLGGPYTLAAGAAALIGKSVYERSADKHGASAAPSHPKQADKAALEHQLSQPGSSSEHAKVAQQLKAMEASSASTWHTVLPDFLSGRSQTQTHADQDDFEAVFDDSRSAIELDPDEIAERLATLALPSKKP